VPYRSDDEKLLELWDRVRNMTDSVSELISRPEYSKRLDDSVFIKNEEDEIILCLNYDGLYGINNLNRFLQERNENEAFEWGLLQYKVGDPILFNESERFAPVIYNNMKGIIRSIELSYNANEGDKITFDIELDKVLDGLDAYGKDFEIIDEYDCVNTVVRFSVYKRRDIDDDDDITSNTIVPFQVAYAISIHRAQGLEYDSVKVVITNEVDEKISHNIFYTAITRARKHLKIYWSPEVQEKILTTIQPRNDDKDVALLKMTILD
jgi:ATP-dependent exoDNAse (exonuclease V) alpha subunit